MNDFRCAVWTREQGVAPIGSAPEFDALVLIEWPLPWPSDVSAIPALAAAVAARADVRVMAVVPRADDGADGSARIVHHRRVGTNQLVGVDHRVPVAAIEEAVGELVADALSDSSGRSTAVGAAPPEVLVCGHGRRDP